MAAAPLRGVRSCGRWRRSAAVASSRLTVLPLVTLYTFHLPATLAMLSMRLLGNPQLPPHLKPLLALCRPDVTAAAPDSWRFALQLALGCTPCRGTFQPGATRKPNVQQGIIQGSIQLGCHIVLALRLAGTR